MVFVFLTIYLLMLIIVRQIFIAGVAQLVEQLICNQQVVRSNRIAGSIVEECPSGQREQTVNLPA